MKLPFPKNPALMPDHQEGANSEQEFRERAFADTGQRFYDTAALLFHSMLIQGANPPKDMTVVFKPTKNSSQSFFARWSGGVEPVYVGMMTEYYKLTCRKAYPNKVNRGSHIYVFTLSLNPALLEEDSETENILPKTQRLNPQVDSDFEVLSGARTDLGLLSDRVIEEALTVRGIISHLEEGFLPEVATALSRPHLRYITESIRTAWTEVLSSPINPDEKARILKELLTLHENRYHESVVTLPVGVKRHLGIDLDKVSEIILTQLSTSFSFSLVTAVAIGIFLDSISQYTGATGPMISPEMALSAQLAEIGLIIATALAQFTTLNLHSLYHFIDLKRQFKAELEMKRRKIKDLSATGQNLLLDGQDG
ncbi:hypothetical protein KC622_03410 [Candidatus Dojkabacteria bacterium]|uniref:Uncharacterized protein n=1 Tax=Candidatus Dojkabacteria bacterium TaxID=2099670 RepID=A0A955HZC5_9BACT|nr:hypothetical protein [Candidatus Dojkabacteria bacterium]